MNRRYAIRSVGIVGVTALVLAGTFGLGMQYKRRHDLLDRRLVGAVLTNDFRTATILIHEGADPNAHYGPAPAMSVRRIWNALLHRSNPSLGDTRTTAFFLACGGHNSPDEAKKWRYRAEPLELVRTMLRNGADVHAKDYYGNTPLVWAIRENQPTIVATLLEHGAEVNVRDTNGWTPLMGAFQSSPQILRLLLEHGADVNAASYGGQTSLLIATHTPAALDTIALLLEHGVSVNAQSQDGALALYRFVVTSVSTHDRQTTDLIPQLLAHGANPNLAIRNGTSALQAAQQNGRPDLVALLRRAGAKK